jgi:hypothetical protein
MIENIFDPQKNPSFKNGDAIRWILTDESGKLLGRIAAFYNLDKSEKFEQPTGGTGFFECINYQSAANMLFDTARNWLKSKGMEAMDGPVNFGENYMNWGLLVDGFMPQGFGMPYNPKYYENLFRNFGFKVYFEQYSFHLDLNVPLPERIGKIAEWIAMKPQYKFKHFDYKNTDAFVKDFCTIYDAAWSSHEQFNPLDQDEVYEFMKKSKVILDPEMVWFAYHEDKPVAMLMTIPDINQILIKLKGKLNFWTLLKFLYYKRINTITRARAILMGVNPKFQRSGLDVGVFWNHLQTLKKKSNGLFKELELSWAGDFNPKIISLYKASGGKHVKTHYTMRYLFDRNKPFNRAPLME